MVKAILFDLDDTLISFDGVTEASWRQACSIFLKKRQLSITEDELFQLIEKTRNW